MHVVPVAKGYTKETEIQMKIQSVDIPLPHFHVVLCHIVSFGGTSLELQAIGQHWAAVQCSIISQMCLLH